MLVGVYRRAWRVRDLRDLATIALASALATLVAFLIVVATRDLGDFPPAVFLVYGVAAAALAARLALARPARARAGGGPDDGRRRVLVVGAGQEGRGLARDLRGDDDAVVVGFLDDNPRLRRRRVQGVPVLGTTDATVRTRADESSSRSRTRAAPTPRTRMRGAGAHGSSASAPRATPTPSPSERDEPGCAAAAGGERHAGEGRGAPSPARRVPPAGDALRLAGVAPRDADDLHRRARD